MVNLIKKTELVYIALGSNLGDRLNNLQIAIFSLCQHLELIDLSNVYQSKAQGISEKDPLDFLNMVALFSTSFNPFELLNICNQIEEEHGRKRDSEEKNSRKIDLDILTYGSQNIEDDFLVIPHAEMFNRDFVLYPLNDIASIDNFDELIKNIPVKSDIQIFMQMNNFKNSYLK